jgi:hypothetical protein
MEKWEYRTIKVRFDMIKSYKGFFKVDDFDWVVKNSDGSQIVGFENILNVYGENGWELVNAVVEDSVNDDDRTSRKRCRLFFKRRIL